MIEPIIFVLVLLTGQILRKTKYRQDIQKFLSIIIIYISLPALVLATFLKNPINISNFVLTPIAFIILMFSIFIAFLISKFLNLDKKSAGSFIITSAHANTGFIGYPVSFYLFGSAGLFYAVIYDLGVFIGLITIVSYVAGIYGEGKKGIFINFLKFPPLYAFILSIILIHWDIKIPEINILELIGSTSLYFTLIYLGIYIDTGKIFGLAKISLISSLIKIGIAPIFALLIIYVAEYTNIQLSEMEKEIVILQSIMPSGLMTIILATHYKLNLDIATNNVLITTLIFFFILLTLSFLF